MSSIVKFKLLHDDSICPEAATSGSSGYDCHAHFVDSSLNIHPGDTHLIALGFSMKIPRGFEGQLRSRSGLALKKGLIVLNAPGTIDSDYEGEVKAIIHNSSKFVETIMRGERICQLIIAKIEAPAWTWYDEHRERGLGGFGSTGDL